MDTITLCSICVKRGDYKMADISDVIRRPLSQCDGCGKKCLGFVVKDSRAAASTAETKASAQSLNELEKEVQTLHV
jgi:hypothetical protein